MKLLKFDWTDAEYLNCADLNRIEALSESLSNQLNDYGYLINFEKREKKWEPSDIPNISDLNRIRRNIQRLRDGYFSIPDWREMIYDNQHDYNRQNAMEWDLQTCYDYVEKMIQISPPCGIYSSGYALYIPSEKPKWKIIAWKKYSGTFRSGGALAK